MLETAIAPNKTSVLHELTEAHPSLAFYDMIVFCHLRWDFVYQRPQHLISRMSKHFKILMIEEPLGEGKDGEKSANLIKVKPQLFVLQPKVNTIEDIAELLPKYIRNEQIEVGWCYSPSFYPLVNKLTFNHLIYDCMDELSLFKGAPDALIKQEQLLLKKADVVFTGGKSLYESKKQLHNNVFCFPSSVDEAHFAKAKDIIAVPHDMKQIPKPIVGYFGVIDERIDFELMVAVATAMPHISFVMVGPLAKIHDSDLPRLPNLYYLGMKTYEELPTYLSQFDMAMMPFALNDATKFISPTKTLEYMAAGKPIISTRIKDVERDYHHCVTLIDNADDFSRALVAIEEQLESENKDYHEVLSRTSWDNTATNMYDIIKERTL
ncbi:glycosyltransferase [Oceanisphaera avium]|uniref:Amine oxidase n=1 Tax=Oceanisphaera avium TaxID=1903694 RepID=A0A1Y0CXZ5_9GAMM|nr:glycosyltransferase [Oceanisphaera avium]ART80192.1 amine oxidase [Oceanisphaera avium]